MPKHVNRFADLPPITDFESHQRVRPLLLHRVGDVLEVWRACKDSACVRARSCRRGDGHCFIAFMQAVPDAERRLFCYSIENRRDGLAPVEAFARALDRVEAEIAQYGC